MQPILGTQVKGSGQAWSEISPSDSLAVAQCSVMDAGLRFPLLPPLLEGIRDESQPESTHPVEIDFDYARFDRSMLRSERPAHGLEKWSPLMPPLVRSTNLGEGATPLVESPTLASWAGLKAPLYIKDESSNPTWSHKDRLNRCAVSVACIMNAPGIAVASSGNHGASASAYAARAGLPCIVLASDTAPLAMRHFVRAYGAAAIAVPAERRGSLLLQIVRATGFHPVSNLMPEGHIGHPFGSEGYKSIAYEIFQDLGGTVPSLVFVPTGYGELLYGVWKGFRELRELGVAPDLPVMIACEPAVLAPHHWALSTGRKFMKINQGSGPTRALSIAAPMGGLRGYKALKESHGRALALKDGEIAEASAVMARNGFWAEFSGAASVAGLHQYLRTQPAPERPVVCINTSSGFKDIAADDSILPRCSGAFSNACEVLKNAYGLKLEAAKSGSVGESA